MIYIHVVVYGSGPICWLVFHDMSPLYLHSVSPVMNTHGACNSLPSHTMSWRISLQTSHYGIWAHIPYLGSGIAGPYIICSLISFGTARLFLEWLYHRARPQQCRMFLVFSYPSQVCLSPKFMFILYLSDILVIWVLKTFKDRLSKMKNTQKF